MRRDLHSRILKALALPLTCALMLCGCDRRSPPVIPFELPLTDVNPLSLEKESSATGSSRLLASGSHQMKFEHISLEHGLSHSTVYAILQDRFGFMWFGTADGLNKFDGYSFTVYRHDPEDPDSLSDNLVWTLFEDQDGVLWIGTSGGLNRFNRNRETFTHYTHDIADPHSLSHDTVRTIFQDRHGVLWVGTDRGLNRFEPRDEQFFPYLYETSDSTDSRFDRTMEHFVRYLYDPNDAISLQNDIIESIYEDSNGTLWIGTRGGLEAFDRQNEELTPFPHDPREPYGLSHWYVRSVYQDRFGYLWVATVGGGLNRYNPENGELSHFQHDPNDIHSLSDDRIWVIYEDTQGELWIGTDKGLNHFDRRRERFDSLRSDPLDPNSLSNNVVYSIYEDRSGVLWVGTAIGGINKHDRYSERFVHFKYDPTNRFSLPDNMVWSIYQDQRGILWVGTDQGLMSINRISGRVAYYRNNPIDADSLISDRVGVIYEDLSGTIWVGTGKGLDRFNRATETFTHFQHNPLDPLSISSNGITTLYVDAAGVLWVGTYGGGFNNFDPQRQRFWRFSLEPNDPSSQSNSVRAFLEDRTGRFWIGTHGGGLYEFDRENETFIHYPYGSDRADSLSDGRVMSIHQDQVGYLWIGTLGGLNRFDPERGEFKQYRERDGLPNDVVYGILEDRAGYLWLSTNKGLSKFNPRTGSFRNYGPHDGLQSNEFNANAFHVNQSGEMFFGGSNGFNAFFPQDIQDNPYVPPLVLTSLTQGGEDLQEDQALEQIQAVTLHWPNNYFEFEFSALSYAQPDRNQYAFILEGFDREWNNTGVRRYGRYTNLPGGEYTLRILGANHDSVWNKDGISLVVTVVPPIWETWLFRGVVGFILIGTILGGYRLRIRNIEARSRQLENQVKHRTYEIERRRQELEALYRADEEMHKHLDLNQVLQALVDVAVDILEADKSSVLVWETELDQLVLRVARGFSSETMTTLTFRKGEGLAGEVAATGEPVIVENAQTDRRWERDRIDVYDALLGEGIRSFMHLPIKLEGQVFAVFNVCFTEAQAFGADEMRLFSALAQRAALAIENAQLYEQTQELAVMEERSRLARDLHDAVTQTLFSASLIAEALPDLWESNQNEGRQLLKEIRQLSRGALAEMRSLLLELRPSSLVEVSLSDLMRQLAETVTGRKGIPVRLDVDGYFDLPEDVHVALYRIAQEALNNVVKHANPQEVSIVLHGSEYTRPGHSPEAGDRKCNLTIQDDGRGFEPSKTPPERMGIRIIRERANAVGAQLEISSQPGVGTCVRVEWKG